METTAWLDAWWFDWVLVAFFSSLILASYYITTKLFRPSWYLEHKNNTKLCENPPGLQDCWRINERNRSGLGNPKTDLGLDYENVEFPCGAFRLGSNQMLRGWFIPGPHYYDSTTNNKSRDLCVVVCHGGGRDRRQHLRHVPTLHNRGASVLLFDKQEHGMSDGNHRGIGWFSYEGSDMYAACRYAKLERKFKRTIAMGTSFGGVAALTAAGYFDMAGKHQMIDGVIAENPPHSRRRFVRDLVHKYGVELGLPGLVRELLGLFSCCTIIARRGSLFTPNPIDVIQNISPRPLLITHGEADTIVPVQHGRDLYEAALAPKDCLWVPKCDHTMVINVDPVGWRLKTTALLRTVLSQEGGVPRQQHPQQATDVKEKEADGSYAMTLKGFSVYFRLQKC